MMELLDVKSLKKSLELIQQTLENKKLKTKKVPVLSSLSYILAKDVYANEYIPSFNRSTVDGYALIAKSSYGASETNPIFLNVVGEVKINENNEYVVNDDECVLLQTGSMLPKNANAVIMKEYCEVISDNKIAIYRSVSHHENVNLIGDDIKNGQLLFIKGQEINAFVIGVLISLGIKEVEVYEKINVAIVSTGDELKDPYDEISNGEIRDVNSYSLKNYALLKGFNVTNVLRLKDDYQQIYDTLFKLVKDNDLIILSGGSSKGDKDYSLLVIDELTENVFVHGIAIKPGKPTILAYDKINECLFIGLPGHPLAALLMFKLLAIDGFNKQMNKKKSHPYYAKISENVSSNKGRETILLVKLEDINDEMIAHPIYTKSGNIYSLTQAYGYVLIDRNKEGLKKGELVKVEVF
ncbi:MAG: molybdopterin molybdotransferase MoeA [Bacilli bacterium]|nr:molybdopterin molybdotransferase MoeA [Bacilli bacterium]